MKFKAATLDRMPILAVAVFLTATTATPVFAQTSQDEEASGGIGEIVVTAQRREANLREVPVAITSTDGKTLAERGLKNVSELTSQLPGVEFSALNTSVSINIRGIGNSNSNQGADPGVAYHLDGVYLAQTALAGSSFLDVERVEVLRGPQGTLFGRNATGGSVNVISRRPTPHFEAEVGVVADVDPSQIHLDGFVSGPLSASGKILARFSARTDFNAGYTKNGLAAGPDHLDGEKRYALRGQLQFEMTPNLTANLAVDYAKANDDGQAVFLLGAPAVVNGMTTTLSPADVAAITATKMGLASTAFGSVDDRRTFANQGARDGSFLGVRAGLEWQGEAGTLKILGAYGRTRLATLLDGDGTSANFTSTLFTQRAHQYFGEAVYSSNGDGPIQFILGANAFRQSSDEYVEVPINNIGAAVKIPSHLITTSYAAFGRLDLRVDDGLKLFAGARFTHDAKSLTETNNFSGTKSDSDSWEQFTYEFGASYEVSRTVNAYAKYATGFKGGGFSAGSLAPPFDPETNQSIEAGLKGLYFDRRLELNLAAYRMKYDDLQVGQVVGAAVVTKNAARAIIKGVELEMVALPQQGLRFEAVAAFTDAKFNQFTSIDSSRSSLGLLDLSGNRLPGSPKWSLSLGSYYDLPFVTNGRLTLGGRYYWKDRIYFSEFNLPIASQEAVGRFDLSLTYASPDDRWQIGVFARNLTDERVFNSIRVVSALLNSASLGRLDAGREIGVSVRTKF